MEFQLFENLIEFKVKIIFIITKTPFDINKESTSQEVKETRKSQRDAIENTIKDKIKNICKEKKMQRILQKNLLILNM